MSKHRETPKRHIHLPEKAREPEHSPEVLKLVNAAHGVLRGNHADNWEMKARFATLEKALTPFPVPDSATEPDPTPPPTPAP